MGGDTAGEGSPPTLGEMACVLDAAAMGGSMSTLGGVVCVLWLGVNSGAHTHKV